MINIEQSKAIERLKAVGLRPSVQRVAVMQYLMTHFTHPTADEIFDAVSLNMPMLSKTTVYNTLKSLVDEKAVMSLSLDEKHLRYDGDVHEHAHFLCTACGAFEDVPMELPNEIKQPQGWKITEVQLYYKGICKECQKNNE